MSELYQDEKYKFWVRDKGDVGEVSHMHKDYKHLVGSGVENPTILDLGGFIGTFVWFAMNKLNPKKVISVEPDPSNIEVYKKNWDGNPKVELIEGAVTMDDGAILPLYLGKTYRSCNSLEHFRGRQSVDVKTVSFKTLLDKYQPDIIKCDIEGGEFNLDWSDLPDCVKMITMEIHQQRPVWIEEMKTIDSELLAQGFEHVAKPKHELTFHKVDLATWRR